MTKYQHVTEKSVQSVYYTFRTISEAVSSGWIHPGSEGLELFSGGNSELGTQSLEKVIEDSIEEIFKTIFK